MSDEHNRGSLLHGIASDDIFPDENQHDTTKGSPRSRSATCTMSLAGVRLVSILFSNLKIVYIAIQLVAICDVNNSVLGTGVDSSCNWYWGKYLQVDEYSYSNDIMLASTCK